MKRNLYTVAMFVASAFPAMGEIQIPEPMADAALMLRPGIQDFGYKSLGEILLDKEFRVEVESDGTELTASYGEIRRSGHTYILPWMLTADDEVLLSFYLHLVDQGQAVLFSQVDIDSPETGFHEVTDSATKLEVILFFDHWIKKDG